MTVSPKLGLCHDANGGCDDGHDQSAAKTLSTLNPGVLVCALESESRGQWPLNAWTFLLAASRGSIC